MALLAWLSGGSKNLWPPPIAAQPPTPSPLRRQGSRLIEPLVVAWFPTAPLRRPKVSPPPSPRSHVKHGNSIGVEVVLRLIPIIPILPIGVHRCKSVAKTLLLLPLAQSPCPCPRPNPLNPKIPVKKTPCFLPQLPDTAPKPVRSTFAFGLCQEIGLWA